MSCNNNSNINETFIIEPSANGGGVTGGTFNYETQTLTLNNADDTVVNISGFADNYTTGATLINNVVYFDRTDALSAYTLDLSAFSNQDIYVTGLTYSNNSLTLRRNDNINLTTTINSFTGLTVNGTIFGTTVSATTYLNLPYDNDNYLSLSGGTVTGETTFTNGLTANTISATTFYGDGSHLTGIVTPDIYVTGLTYNNSLLTLYRNDGVNLEIGIDSFSAITVTDNTLLEGNVTLSAINEGTDYNMLTIDDGGNIHKKPIELKKILIKEINLGSRLLYNDGGKADITKQLSNILDKRELAYIINNESHYRGAKIAYYYTLDYSPLTSSTERNKYLSKLQNFSINYDSLRAFNEMYNEIVDSSYFYNGISVNFYCEVYFESDFNYLAPMQLNLVNPLFNSLRPDKYSRSKNWLGIAEYVQNVNERNNHGDNTIYEEFRGHWATTYNSTIDTINYDIPKAIFAIVNQGDLYSSLSGESIGSICRNNTWDSKHRDSVRKSTYVESVKKFRRKFRIPTNLNAGFALNTEIFHNFYGTLVFGSGDHTLLSYPNESIHQPVTFLQMIDNYRLYPNGNTKLIYSTNADSTTLTNLTYNVNNYNLKYISNRVKFGNYSKGFIDNRAGILQVVPRYCENYALKLSITNNILTPLNFLNDLHDNYFYGNDPSMKGTKNGWHELLLGTSRILINQIELDRNPYGPFILLQSSEDKINKFKAKPYWEDITPFILIGGEFAWNDDSITNRLAELDMDGNFVNDLNVQSGFNDAVWVITTDSHNNIFVGGDFTTYQGNDALRFIKLNQDGSPDTNFTYGYFDNTVRAITVQPDGKILVGGLFTQFYDRLNDVYYYVNGLLRLNTDGSYDTTFNNGNNPFPSGGSIASIIIQPDDKILIGGFFFMYYDSPNDSNYYPGCIARINQDGSVDTSFITAPNGNGFNSTVLSIALQSNGNILVGGSFNDYYDSNYGYYYPQYFCRLNADGSFDTTFLGNEYGFNSLVSSIVIQNDNKIIVGGYFEWFYTPNGNYNTRYLVRMTEDGIYDTTFIQDGYGFNEPVMSLVLQSDGKLLVGGHFTTYVTSNNYWNSYHIIRLNQDGSPDYTNGGYFQNPVLAIALNNRINGTINIDAIYKGHSFRPSLYPLSQTQLLLDVPETFKNGTEDIRHVFNIFSIDGTGIIDKELCLIVNLKKINEKCIITCPLKNTGFRRAMDNIFNTLTPTENDIETLIYANMTETHRKYLRPNNAEVYFGIIDNPTRIISILPNYKMILENYGNNEIFKIVQGGIEM